MLRANAGLHSIIDHDGAIILDIKRDAMLTLNATGGYVWQRLQQGKLIDDIIRDLSQETGMEFAAVERDVHRFLEQLKKRRLLDDTDIQDPITRFR